MKDKKFRISHKIYQEFKSKSYKGSDTICKRYLGKYIFIELSGRPEEEMGLFEYMGNITFGFGSFIGV